MEIPETVCRVLLQVLEAMKAGKAVTVAPQNTLLTTQQVADLLGVSRPTVVKLIENGELPAQTPGQRRRRSNWMTCSPIDDGAARRSTEPCWKRRKMMPSSTSILRRWPRTCAGSAPRLRRGEEGTRPSDRMLGCSRSCSIPACSGRAFSATSCSRWPSRACTGRCGREAILEELLEHESLKPQRRGVERHLADAAAAHLIDRMRAEVDDAVVTGWGALEGSFGLPERRPRLSEPGAPGDREPIPTPAADGA
ncbi:MAG: excisionase family DNA-binding protein [Candidatus Nanopelagicales bacterium]